MNKDEFCDSLDGDLSSKSLKSYCPDQNCESTSVCFDDFVLKLTSSTSSEMSASSSNVSVIVIKPAPKSVHQKSKSIVSLESYLHSKCNIENDKLIDISSIVPLYDGDRNRSDLKKIKQPVSTPAVTPKMSNEKRRLKARSNDGPVVRETSKKSYLQLFYKRIGYPEGSKKVEPKDTCRSLYGDSRRSSISLSSTDREDFKDAEDAESCTTSLYFKDIVEADRSKISRESSLTPNTIPILDMKSISDIFSEGSVKEKKTTSNRRKTTPISIPVLGGLGPNLTCVQDKLERRKKQIWYGQKCSNRNRMKVMVMKNLEKLKNDT